MKILYLINLLLLSFSLCGHHSKEEWKSRTIYQLLTDRFASTDDKIFDCINLGDYCGGTFKGIIQHLDYIAGMGFNAIWISPPLKNKEGSYHGYHNIDLNNINEHFGTKEELKQLIEKCHENDIWVIFDFVPNHMADGVDFSNFVPFNDAKYFHDFTDSYCEGHWNEQWYKENCRLYGMPDLKHEDEFVNSTLINVLKNTLNEYNFDAVRYADVVNVPTWFWSNLTHAVNGMFTLGVFDDQNVSYVASYQQYMDGVADFPLFYQLRRSFCDESMIDLYNYINNSHPKYISPQYNAIWFDNHDQERFLYQCTRGTRAKALRNIVVFTFFFQGIPIFYYGDEQYLDNGGINDRRRQTLFNNYDEESDLYQLIKTVNKLRKDYNISNADFVTKYVDVDNYVFMRGKDLMIAVSRGLRNTIEITDHGFNSDDKFCNKLKSGDCATIKNDVLMIRTDGEPKIYIRQSEGELIYISSYLFLFLILLF